jgi:putative ABC transport system permease protein
MLKDYIVYIWRNFTHRKIRGWLTILGILIGVAAVIALISVTQGMQDAINEQFARLGTNKIMVTSGGGEGAMGLMGSAFAAKPLTKDDLEVVKKSSGADIATELIAKMGKVKFGDQTKYTFVIGMPVDESANVFKDMQGFEAEFGRQIKEGDKYSINIGYLIGQPKGLFDKAVKIGNKLEIEGQEFKVVGIIKKLGNKGDDTQIYIPIDVVREIYNEHDKIDYIYIQTKQGLNVNDVADEIKKDLRNFRDEKKGEETFQVQTFEQIIAQVNTILNIVGIVLIAISAISLIVGGVGIMNSMYTSVLERTHEIGVMKAIGARNSHILAIFMIESGLYGLVGGAVGVIIGLAMAKLAELAAISQGVSMFRASITPALILGGLAFSFFIGCISGAAPARTASRMRPVDALRYE